MWSFFFRLSYHATRTFIIKIISSSFGAFLALQHHVTTNLTDFEFSLACGLYNFHVWFLWYFETLIYPSPFKLNMGKIQLERYMMKSSLWVKVSKEINQSVVLWWNANWVKKSFWIMISSKMTKICLHVWFFWVSPSE